MATQNDADRELHTTKPKADFAVLMSVQKRFQLRLGKEDLFNDVEFIKEQAMALMIEVAEALNETPWKSWKKNQQLNLPAFREELADIQLFLINLVIASGLSADGFIELCRSKQRLNESRQQEGY